MVSDREMEFLLELSLKNFHPDQLELCFWETEGNQLVFA